PCAVVVISPPREVIRGGGGGFRAGLFRCEPTDPPLLVRDIVFRSLDGHERDVRRSRTVRMEGALEDEMVPTRQGRMIRHEGDVDHFLQETGAGRERR